MKMPRPVCVDFETFAIEDRPVYPPKPVGIAIKYPGRKSRYYGWGHPTGNTCTRGEGLKAVKEAWAYGREHGILGQNLKFDRDVAETHCGMRPLPWDKVHDTMFLLFLDDPHQQELSLKPSAERLLGWAPEEQDAVADWLVEHQPLVAAGIKISRSKSSDNYFAKYIAFAPGDIVGPYACGDVDRAEAIFNLLWKKTCVDRNMLAAYDRERKLAPILLEMERDGVPADGPRLKRDVQVYTDWREKLDAWIRKKLRASGELNLDSGDQLVDALVQSGLADPSKMSRTATGKISSAKGSLLVGVTDAPLLAALKYRTQLGTSVETFMSTWVRETQASGGRIFTSWNQVRSPRGADNSGTRTGRLSARLFMNIPREFTPIWKHEAPKGAALPPLPAALRGLPALPNVRSYIIPGDGCAIADRDYSQQEPRILAHFDGGALMQRYNDNPWTDFHDFARMELEKVGLFYDRKPVKNTNLGLIYGMGVGLLAAKNGMEVDEAARLKKAVLALYPGLREMYRDMKVRAMSHQPIRTWGGREYYCEEPKLVDGRIREFDYKMVNVLIQGSAADCTKEAIIRFYDTRDPAWKLLLNIHDELMTTGPRRQLHAMMQCLKEAMESVEFDVPMLSEGTASTTNWGDLTPYDEKGKFVWPS